MTLTSEQQQALDELFVHVPPSSSGIGAAAQPDFLQTWFGVSASELKARLMTLIDQKDAFESRLLDMVEHNPLDAAMSFLAGASYAFYIAEKDINPRIKTYVDAFYYISTCASVGYADIFAATQTGRAIAGLVMIVGPALTNRALDRPRPLDADRIT
ncbi:MAG: two pore domain potassium channel family protein [Chloroflexi bacterium]|nr:two pore domain potassium channel family protein [Chloroflexota bacterium]